MLLARGVKVEEVDRIQQLEAELAAAKQALKDADRARAVSEARYRSMFEHGPDAMLIVSFEGTIESSNRTAKRKFRALTLDGEPLSTLFDADSRPAIQALFGPGVEGSLDQEHRLVDGRAVHLRAAPLPGVEALQFSLVDVSDRVALQHEVREARRLAAIGELASGMAHEINNPLTVLQLRLDLLRERLVEPDTRQQLDVVMQNVRRVIGTVEGLQAIASPAGPERVVDADDVVQAAVERSSPWLREAELELDIESGLRLRVRPARLEVVLSSLLAHAGEVLRSSGGTVSLVAKRDDGSVRFEVRDDGPPLSDPSHLDLSRSHRSRSSERGHALGLALAWTLVREDGGDLQAVNGAGRGVCMSFSVPLAPGATPQESSVAQPWRILLVDDEDALRDVMASWAQRMGYQLQMVGTAEEALERVDSHPFDAVIADVRLPGMSGQALVARWRQRRPDLARRTLLTSGMLLEEEEGQPFLRKPFTLERLERALAAVLTR